MAEKNTWNWTACCPTCSFQSSSYWRMAEKKAELSKRVSPDVVSILIILANGWKDQRKRGRFAAGVHVSILIILANGWKAGMLVTAKALGTKFQSSSYWRMAEKLRGKSPRTLTTACFNPHHTGEWLKSRESSYPERISGEFQSSSYWRMAEKRRTVVTLRSYLLKFQSSSYWRMAEKRTSKD